MLSVVRLRQTCAAVALVASGAASALPSIDLGPASAFSGFFFGNVNAASDVEGRLAVGGDLTSGFDIGYRNPLSSTAPSLVVGGSVNLKSQWGGFSGSIYNGPNYETDTNASIGPGPNIPWVSNGKTRAGDIVYGSTLVANSWQYGSATKNASFIDFASAKTQLSSLSQQLNLATPNGTVTAQGGNLLLTGDGTSNVQVFNLGDRASIGNLTLSNVKAGAHIIINSSASSITFSGGVGGELARPAADDLLALSRDRLVFNLSNAQQVDVRTFVNGSILAVGAAVTGSGHIEGTLVADSLSRGQNGTLELGYEYFTPYVSPVPEPQTAALLAAGLVGLGWLGRRRKQAQNQA
ncbi:choice-of-anchor A family protein [Roseateles sp. BYS180W]|uniref:Choice-of-anchor A family protein n=1 Tax=Roseateles rivi TaxID=3299028 RepID=A0ABW7FRR3_9BURK